MMKRQIDIEKTIQAIHRLTPEVSFSQVKLWVDDFQAVVAPKRTLTTLVKEIFQNVRMN